MANLIIYINAVGYSKNLVTNEFSLYVGFHLDQDHTYNHNVNEGQAGPLPPDATAVQMNNAAVAEAKRLFEVFIAHRPFDPNIDTFRLIGGAV